MGRLKSMQVREHSYVRHSGWLSPQTLVPEPSWVCQDAPLQAFSGLHRRDNKCFTVASSPMSPHLHDLWG